MVLLSYATCALPLLPKAWEPVSGNPRPLQRGKEQHKEEEEDCQGKASTDTQQLKVATHDTIQTETGLRIGCEWMQGKLQKQQTLR